MPKLLVVRFSSIGDIVLTTPVLRGLKQQTDYEVHFLTKKAFSPLLVANPYVAKLFCIEKDTAEILPALEAEQYDLMIDLHHNLRSLALSRELKVKSHRFNKLNIQKWLLVNLKINKLPDVHIVQRYLKTVQPLGVKDDGQGLDFFIKKEDQVAVSDLGLKKNEYIVFVLGAAHVTKQIPESQLIKIAAKLAVSIVLIGGSADAEIGARLEAQMGKKAHNFCGKMNLGQSASLIQQSRVVLTPDTGMMHIAAALQRPTVVLWGNTVPEFGMFPFRTQHIDFQVNNLSCRPCSKIGYPKCPKGHFRCMLDQSPADISAKLNAFFVGF